MRVCQHKAYNREFPGKFNWALVESPLIDRIARKIVERIADRFQSNDRTEISGLRAALRAIALEAESF